MMSYVHSLLLPLEKSIRLSGAQKWSRRFGENIPPIILSKKRTTTLRLASPLPSHCTDCAISAAQKTCVVAITNHKLAVQVILTL